jgi:hypothetical protein
LEAKCSESDGRGQDMIRLSRQQGDSMTTRMTLTIIVLLTFPALLTADPAPAPAPAANPPKLSPAQDARLLDLSDAEANIQAINKALFRAGYKVGVAYDQIDSHLKGNELMDRKGGGPVRWDEFYGRTARGYAGNGWGDRRPQQFDYIYKANNDKIRQALDKISAIQGNKSALLARRRAHEENQSRLWAMLAFQQVHDREIFLDDLTQFALKPAGPEANALRPIILFLRTADRVAADGLDTIKTDQPGTFRAADERMRKAYADLQKSLADALGAPAFLAARREKATGIKALCKNLSEECEIAAGDYAKSLDSDAAGEDTTKLLSRARLQTALYTFASNVDELYDQVTKTAKEWNITGDRGTPTPDAVAAVVMKPDVPANTAVGTTTGEGQRRLGPKRLLVVTATVAFRHTSIATAEKVLQQLANQSGAFTVDFVRQPGDLQKLSPDSLKDYDGVVFANTSGDLPLPDRPGFLDWIKAGHGFIGVHSASDTLHNWPGYIDMLGGELWFHKAPVGARLINAEPKHPADLSLGATWDIQVEELYRFKNCDPNNKLLLFMDRAPDNKTQLGRFPVSWCRDYGNGKVFYTSLGHREDIWDADPSLPGRRNRVAVSQAFQNHLLGGINWALGLEPKN